MLESAIMKSEDVPAMLDYALGIAMSLLQIRAVRNTVSRSGFLIVKS